MGKRIKLTKTDVFLLGLTVLFVLAMALTWLLTPRQVRGGYDISAVPPEEAAPALLKVNINTASAEELDGLPGIGPVLAQRIVDEREANGPYTGAEDLTRPWSDEVDGVLEEKGVPFRRTGFRSDRDVREEASELLADRREEGDCVLMRAGYLDLFGGTWGCVLQGVDWVEICLVGEEGDGCVVGVWRMDVDDAVRELGATSGVSASPQ